MKKATFYFPLMPYCLTGSDNARSHVHSIGGRGGAYPSEKMHKAVISAAEKQKLQEALLPGAEGTWSLAAVTLRGKLPIHSPPAIRARRGSRYFPLPLLVTDEPPGMLMPYPLLCSMNKQPSSELGLVGSFAPLIRKDLGFGWGFVVCFVVGLQ